MLRLKRVKGPQDAISMSAESVIYLSVINIYLLTFGYINGISCPFLRLFFLKHQYVTSRSGINSCAIALVVSLLHLPNQSLSARTGPELECIPNCITFILVKSNDI